MNRIFDDINSRIIKDLEINKTLEKLRQFRKLFASGNIREIENLIRQIAPEFLTNLSGIFNNAIFQPKSQIANFSELLVILGKRKALETLSIFIIFNDLFRDRDWIFKSKFFHNIATAIISDTAYQTLLNKTDENFEAFVSAFFHNFGKLLLLRFDKGVYIDIIEEAKSEQLNYYEVEQILYGNTFQGRFAISALRYLQYSDVICDVVEFYNDIDKSKHNPVCAIMHISDIIATALCIDEIEDYKLPMLRKSAFKYFSLTSDSINLLYKSFMVKLLAIPKFYEAILPPRKKNPAQTQQQESQSPVQVSGAAQ